MKNYFLFLLAAVIIVPSCRQKKKEKEKKFISVLSLVENQVAHIDTALYSITKIIYTDSLHSDTTYIRREDFRSQAKDFLEIPDLSDIKVAARYNEEARYDETLNRVVITYTPQNPDKEEIQKQEILITPNPTTGDEVNSIIINRVVSNRNGFLQKNMLWQMDKSFQVVTTSQKPGEPEITTTMKVTWNEDNDE
jgi:hypothetical protein